MQIPEGPPFLVTDKIVIIVTVAYFWYRIVIEYVEKKAKKESEK